MKNPFIIKDSFISPKLCEQLTNDLLVTTDLVDTEFDTQTSVVIVDDHTVVDYIIQLIQPLYKEINELYNVNCKKVEKIFFSYLKNQTNGTPLTCFNSTFSKEANTWVRTEYNDFTISLFLSSHFNPQEPFDEEYEHVGGKIQFPQHDISIMGERGGVIIHPSDPHFIRNISNVTHGTCMVVDVLVSCEHLYIYDPITFNNIKEKQ